MQKIYGNLAYDVSEIDYTRMQRPAKPQIKVVEKPKQRTRFKLGFVKFCNFVMVGVIATCAMLVISSYVDATVMAKEQSSLVSDLDKLKSQQVLLNAQMDNLFNLEFVESFAETELSMVKLGQNQIEQVYIQNTDKVEVNSSVKSSNSFLSTFDNVFSNLVAYIG